MTEATYKSISDISKLLDIPTHTLRFWEEKFPYLNPKKINGGIRYYTDSDISYLTQIKIHLKEKGYTIKGVKNLINTIGVETFRDLSKEIPAGDFNGKLPVEQVKFDNIKVKEDVQLPIFSDNEPPLPMFADMVDKDTPNIEKIQDILTKLKKIRKLL